MNLSQWRRGRLSVTVRITVIRSALIRAQSRTVPLETPGPARPPVAPRPARRAGGAARYGTTVLTGYRAAGPVLSPAESAQASRAALAAGPLRQLVRSDSRPAGAGPAGRCHRRRAGPASLRRLAASWQAAGRGHGSSCPGTGPCQWAGAAGSDRRRIPSLSSEPDGLQLIRWQVSLTPGPGPGAGRGGRAPITRTG
eukprot:705416-Hanusia_phi.AAC.1